MKPMLIHDIATMLAEVDAHRAADQVVQGTYWTGSRGCFIGCLSHSSRAATLTERFGLPLPLVRLCEHVFEKLPADEAREFFSAIPRAIGSDGKDLSRLHWMFLASELRALPAVPAKVQAVIDPVIAGMDRLAAGLGWPEAGAARAARAAWAADAEAWAAAWAARAAWAEAWVEAWAAAWAAAMAAEAAAAEDAAITRQRDTLLRLMAEAPVVDAVGWL